MGLEFIDAAQVALQNSFGGIEFISGHTYLGTSGGLGEIIGSSLAPLAVAQGDGQILSRDDEIRLENEGFGHPGVPQHVMELTVDSYTLQPDERTLSAQPDGGAVITLHEPSSNDTLTEVSEQYWGRSYSDRPYYRYITDFAYEYPEPDDSGGLGGGRPPPPDFGPYGECLTDTSSLTPEQLEDYLVAVEAAEIAREIASRADKDSIEFGSIIYKDLNGVITHTPLSPGTATSVYQWNLTGLPGWGTALGMVHSHPAVLYDQTVPNFRLYPTPYRDWTAFNGVQSLIAGDLRNNYGYGQLAADSQASQFVQFVYGAWDERGTNNYSLFRYEDGDEAYQAIGDDQISHSDYVSTTLGTCGV